MAIGYLLSAAALWAGMMTVRKSGEKQNFLVWLFLSALGVMGFQALYGGVLNKLGIGLTLLSMGAGNLAAAVLCFLWTARKGRQAYGVKLFDIVSAAAMTGMVLVFCLIRYGSHLDRINFVSTDSAAHAGMAIRTALEHRLPTNLYFTCVNTGMMMQVYQALTGAGRFDLYRVFLLCESVYAGLAALLFWGLIRQRCGEGKWQLFLPLLLTPFYWAGYPVYSTLFGFSYLGMSVCLLTAVLTLLDLYGRDRIRTGAFIAGMNLALYGLFICYTLFVPTAFFGAFASLAWKMGRDRGKKLISGKNILMMLKVFLLPTVLGLMYSFSNVGELASGGGIRNEGGCYNDIYSNFILLIPFMALGIYFLVTRKEGGYLLPMTAVQVILMGVMMAGLLTRRVSVYYYTKMNSVFWLLSWALTAEAVLGMMHRCRWAILFPFFFYGVVFTGKYMDSWMEKANRLAGRVEVWNFCDLIMINNTYFNSQRSILPADTMELYRYAEEHFEPGEAAGVHDELENRWFGALTGQENTYTYASPEEFLQETEEKGIRYIVAGYSDPYLAYEEYLDRQEVVTENSAGKIFRVTVKSSDRSPAEAPPAPGPEEGGGS